MTVPVQTPTAEGSSTSRWGLRCRRIVTPEGEVDGVVVVADGRIEAVWTDPALRLEGLLVEDLQDAVLLPGLVDSHVHINEPGRSDWEGFASATRAAAAGGVTTLVDMPLNSLPVTIDPEALAAKRRVAEGQLSVDVGFWAGLVPDSDLDALDVLVEEGVCGVKVFLVDSGIDEFPPVGERHLKPAMERLAQHGVPLLAHAELPPEATEAPKGLDPSSYRAYLESRPSFWEERAIKLLVDLCRSTRCPVHIVHLATASALPTLRAARRAGLPITVETCPHYLVFSAPDVPDGDTRFKCAPPIRDPFHREALWRALRSEEIDLVASDHSPAPDVLKGLEGNRAVTRDFQRAWGGIASLQVALSAVWTEARRRGGSPTDLARWMASAPATLAGLDDRKGAIRPGLDADLVAWFPDRRQTVDGALLEHRHPATPYHGRSLWGVVDTTWVRGHRVYDRSAFAAPPVGRVLRRGGDSGQHRV